MTFPSFAFIFKNRQGAIGTIVVLIGMAVIGIGILAGNYLRDPNNKVNIFSRAAIEQFPIEAAWTNEGTASTVDDRIDVVITNFPCSDGARNQIKVYDSRNNNKEIGLMTNYSLAVPTAAGTKGSCYFGKYPANSTVDKAYFRFYGTKEQLRAKNLPQYVKFGLPTQTQFSNEIDLGGSGSTSTAQPVDSCKTNADCMACGSTCVNKTAGLACAAVVPNFTCSCVSNKCVTAGSTQTSPANFPATTISCKVSGNSITWTWGTVTGAGDYFLDLKGNDGSSFSEGWVGASTRTKTITGTPGVGYTAKVMGTSVQHSNGTYSSASCSIPSKAPTIFPATTISCKVSGNSITWTWGTVTGAGDYFLDLKGNDGSSWSEGWVGASTRTKTITGTPGVGYTAKVMGTSVQHSNGTYSSAACTASISAPILTCQNQTGGVKFDWNKVSGATNYNLEVIWTNTGGDSQQGVFSGDVGNVLTKTIASTNYGASFQGRITAKYGTKVSLASNAVNCTVIQPSGGIKITIGGTPPAGAQWRTKSVAGRTTAWRASGDTEPKLDIGYYVIEFQDVTGFTKPTNLTAVTVSNGNVTPKTSGAYVAIPPTVKPTVKPTIKPTVKPTVKPTTIPPTQVLVEVACARIGGTPATTGFNSEWKGNSGTKNWRLWEGSTKILTGTGAYDLKRIFLWNTSYRLEYQTSDGAYQISGDCNFNYANASATPAVKPDLTIAGSIVVNPTTAEIGKVTNIKFTIKNTGTSYGAMVYSYTNQAGGQISLANDNTCKVMNLAVGASCVSSNNFTFATAGTKILSIGIDPQNTVVESNENNNQFTTTVIVNAPGTINTPTIAQISCPRKAEGDADCNGKIEYVDFVCWRGELNGKKPINCKSANFVDPTGGSKGTVDAADYAIWFTTFKRENVLN